MKVYYRNEIQKIRAERIKRESELVRQMLERGSGSRIEEK